MPGPTKAGDEDDQSKINKGFKENGLRFDHSTRRRNHYQFVITGFN